MSKLLLRTYIILDGFKEFSIFGIVIYLEF